MAEANPELELGSALESLVLEDKSSQQIANKPRKKRGPQKKETATKNVQKSPTRPRPGAQQPLRVAAAEAGLSLSDPGNLHPKRKGTPSRNKSGGNTGQHSHPGSGVYRRKSDASGNRDSMRSPLPPHLKYQHQVHKCSWSDAGSVSSRSSTDLLSSPGPSRAGQGQPHSFSYSVPTTPNQKSRRGQGNEFHPFDAFLPLCEIQAGLKKGEFFEGTLRVNPRCFEDSFISAPEPGPHWDIHIEGRHNRNRALSGDKVAVALLPKEEWKVHWDVISLWEKKNGVSLLNDLQASSNTELPQNNLEDSTRQKLATLEAIKEEMRTETSSDGVKESSSDTNIADGDCDEKPIGIATESPADASKNIKDEKADPQTGWGSTERSTMDDVITFTGLKKLESMVKSMVQCESDRLRDDFTFAGSYEYVNLGDEDDESPVLEFTARELEQDLPYEAVRAYRNDSLAANQVDEPTTDESSGDGNHDENYESDESHGDLAESLHFASNEAQVCPREETPSKKQKASTTSSDESQNKIQDEVDAAPLENRPKKKDVDSKVLKTAEQKNWKQMRQKKKRPNEEKQLPEKQWSVEAASEETSEHKEETQDEERPAINTKKRKNRKKKPGLVQRFNLTPEDLGFPSVISESENRPDPDENYEDFIELTNVDSPSALMLAAMLKGMPKKPARQQQQQQQQQQGRKTRKDHKESLRSPRASKEKSRGSPRHKKSETRETIKAESNSLRPYHIDDILAHREWPRFVQRKARVVAVLEESASRSVCGTLRKFNDKKDNFALFSPTDSRFPRLCIPASQCPKDFMKRPGDFETTLFCARLEEWDAHNIFPRGRLLKIVGKQGEIEAETAAILNNNGIDDEEFRDEVFAGLDVNTDWKIPARELESRRDFRKELVFTIDPKTARDLDDALSVRKIADDLYEVGIHIADVSYFVKSDTALNSMALSRATSVYLVQKVVPMLPRLLCNNFCSLHPGTDKLTFSVVLKMNSQGEVFEEWFGRTLINSCCKMSYEFAQDIIDNPKRTWTPDELPDIFNGRSVAEISESVLILQKMAKHMRKRRFDEGALRIDQLTLSFQLATDGVPQGFFVSQHNASHRLIEEFMLLANMAVAHKIRKDFPSLAFLRRHPAPDERRINLIAEYGEFQAFGVNVDGLSSKSLQQALNTFMNTDFKLKVMEEIGKQLQMSETESREALTCAFAVMLLKPFSPAQYIVAEGQTPEALRHFALAVPLYTHFTSPIRRYADLVVHRLLAESLGYAPSGYGIPSELKKVAAHCNKKNRAAKEASSASVDLFVWNFVRTLTDHRLEDNFIVVSVLDRSVDVVSLKTGSVVRAYQDKQRCCSVISRDGSLTFRWKNSSGSFVDMTLSVASPVKGVLEARKESCLYTVRLKPPEGAILEPDAANEAARS